MSLIQKIQAIGHKNKLTKMLNVHSQNNFISNNRPNHLVSNY